MPSYEVRPNDDGTFHYVRLSAAGKVTKRSKDFSMFEAAVAEANQTDPEGPSPDVHPDLLES